MKRTKKVSGLSPIRWLTLSAVWKGRLLEALKGNVAGEQIGQAFIDRLQARRQIVDKVYWKVGITNMVLIAALFLNAVVLPPDISIAGLTAKNIGAVKEIVLFVTATLYTFLAFLGCERHILKTISLAWAEKTFVDEAKPFAQLVYGDIFFEVPNLSIAPGGYKVQTQLRTNLQWLLVGLLGVWFFAWIAATFGMYVVVAIDVATAPSLPPIWSKIIIVYAAVAFVINFLISCFLHLPMPYRDYSLVVELSDLQKRSKAEYEARLKEVAKSLNLAK